MIIPYLILFLLPFFSEAALGAEGRAPALTNGKAVIYYNEACSDCGPYIEGTLIPALKESGVEEIIKKDYLNDEMYRRELFERKQALGVPIQIQGHITAFVNEKVILEGHVPRGLIIEILDQSFREPDQRLLILQDEMKDPTHYLLWDFKREPRNFSIDVPISKALADMEQGSPARPGGEGILLTAVLIAGLLDGINPCAFAVLLFFIAFLFTLKRSRHDISRMGIVYISGIYLTYLLIGLGLLKAFTLTQSPHLLAKVGAILVIFLGAIHVKDYFFPNLPISLKVPKVGEQAIVQWAYRASLPAGFVLGVLVGLCTFPCSGGIYVAVIGLLQSELTFSKGLAYLLLYNLMFVLPLVLILMAASSRRLTGRLLHEERKWKEKIHLLYGMMMIGVGAAILLWFV